MPYARRVLGEDTADRLLDRKDLNKVSIPGGGEAYSGPVASQALKALGAEAMTVDKTVIVSEDFDPGNPEHMALYAHEQYHVQQGTGEGGAHHIHEAEEVAARAVQRMVFHRMAGGYEGGFQPGANVGAARPDQGADQGGRGAASFGEGGDRKPQTSGRKPDPNRGYQALLAQGLDHGDVVAKLANDALRSIDQRKEQGLDRHNDKKGFL